MEDVLVVAIPSLLLVAILSITSSWHRWLRHRELIALAEQGLVPPPARRNPRQLFFGLNLTAIGLALCIGLYPMSRSFHPGFFLGIGPELLFGLIPLALGLSLLLSWHVGRSEEPEPVHTPPPAFDRDPGAEMPDVAAWLDDQDQRALDPFEGMEAHAAQPIEGGRQE